MVRILVCDPSRVDWVHVDIMSFVLGSWCPGDHVEGGFGHVGMGMGLLLELTIEHTLHGRNVDDPGWGWALHLLLELAYQLEGDDWVDDLGRETVQDVNLLDLLDPSVFSTLVCRLVELV